MIVCSCVYIRMGLIITRYLKAKIIVRMVTITNKASNVAVKTDNGEMLVDWLINAGPAFIINAKNNVKNT